MNLEKGDMDLRDILFFCIRKWYIFVIIVILGVSLVLIQRKNTVAPEVTQEALEEVVLYERAKDYLDNSILMNINPLEVCTETLCYNVILNEAVGEDRRLEYTDIVISQYSAFVQSGELAKRVAKALDADEKTIDELISGSGEGISYTVKILAENSKQGDEIADAVDDEIEKYKSEVTEALPEHQITCISRGSKEVVDLSLRTRQQQIESYVQTLEADALPASVQQGDSSRGYWKKFILLVAGGWVLVLAGLLLAYIYGGRIRNGSEITAEYGMQGLADYVVLDDKSFFWKKMQYSGKIVVDKQKCAELLAVKIASQYSGSKVYLTSAVTSDLLTDVMRLTEAKLSERDICAEYIEEIQTKPDMIEKIQKTERAAVLLAEKIGNAKKSAVRAEMELYRDCSIEVERAVILY